jgi:hypothetical protein
MGSSDADTPTLTVLFPQDGESWQAFLRRAEGAAGPVLLVLAGRERELIERVVLMDALCTTCAAHRERMTVATRHPVVARTVREAGIPVIDRIKHLRTFLKGHPALPDVLRALSPQLWKQQLTSRLQRMGLLSMPRLRIFSLVALSILLFYIVVFRLLPSAEIAIRPRQEPVTQTVNVFLVSGTGSVGPATHSVRTVPLIPIIVELSRQLSFSHISKEFTGTSASVRMTVLNTTDEEYALRAGTRFRNQAGMVFRSETSVIVTAGGEAEVTAVADATDVYGQIIGERGNLPAGVKWELPGLSEQQRLLVYAENRVPSTGGTTHYTTVVRAEDIELGRKRLEQELLAAARRETDRRLERMEAGNPGSAMELLRFDELTEVSYHDMQTPTDQIGTPARAIDLSGRIRFRIFAYDAAGVLPLLLEELRMHVRDGRRLVEEHLSHERLVAHVINYATDQSWIKLTVDLSATEEYVLDPLEPSGALFARTIRELVAGKSRDEALRIIRNLPEVESATISQWPPWQRILPTIGAHISIVTY